MMNTYFSIKTDEPGKYIRIFTLTNPGEAIDNFIIKSSVLNGKTIINPQWTEGSEVPKMIKNDNQEYFITRGSLVVLGQEVLPLYKVCKKYSSRVIHELSEFYAGICLIPLDIRIQDFEIIDNYYSSLGKESTLEA